VIDYKCRGCGCSLVHVFANLGRSPPSNAFRTLEQLDEPEMTLPLRVFVCRECQLVQLPAYEKPENIFNEYAYFSSYSPTWVEHMRRYAAAMTAKHRLGAQSLVLDVASNDGYLLKHFKEFGVPVMGVDPAKNVADIAIAAGIPTFKAFFGEALARDMVVGHGRADLINATNVLAHVPDIHDFVEGFRIMLQPAGTITFEFPHVLNLIRECQLDTIYHEHYSYLSLRALEPIFKTHDLRVYDIDQLPTHGGSLRLHVCHAYDYHAAIVANDEAIYNIQALEVGAGLHELETYTSFASEPQRVKVDFLDFLIRQKKRGKMIVGYGAPAKATTLLNYCGVGPELISYTVDATPAKQWKYIPGVQIPIFPEEELVKDRPDFVVIFPWNLKDPIMQKAKVIREWGGKFVTAIPKLQIIP
jgi:SAM-dependent methyltransferase